MKNDTSDTGAKREALSLKHDRTVPLEAIAAASAAFEYGVYKYSERNWEKGLPWQQLIDSLKRHVQDFERRIDIDGGESGSDLPQVCMIMASAMMLTASVMRGIGKDDRMVEVDDKTWTAKECSKWVTEQLENSRINHMTKDQAPTDNEFGNKVWKNSQGQFHRTDGPAIEYANGDKSWYQNGKPHRTDGPAIELVYGYKSWVQNGKLHRTNGPAIEYADGDKEFYVEGEKYTEEEFNNLSFMDEDLFGNKFWKNGKGQLHRTEGPAVERKSGYKAWYQNEKRHRTDGPAIEYSSGAKAWYQNGKRHRTDGPAIEYENGDKFWYQNGKPHRTDGPAIEYMSGYKAWFIEGVNYTEDQFNNPSFMTETENGTKFWKNAKDQYHRTDGPAVEFSNGDRHWFQNGKLHRTDGPAIEYISGYKAWYQNGNRHRTDGPAIEYENGDKSWYQNGKPHRTDGPAIKYPNGDKHWFQNGKLHRTDGPAIEYMSGNKAWYIEGVEYTEDQFNKKFKK